MAITREIIHPAIFRRLLLSVVSLGISCFCAAQAQVSASFGFELPVAYTLGQDVLAESVAVGDVTGDGRPDAVLTTTSPRAAGDMDDYLEDYQVLVFVQDAQGRLMTPLRYPYQSGALGTGLALGDMNKDGINDIVVGHNHGITIMLADGCGAFTVRRHDGPMWAFDVGLLDIDRDGNLDVVGQSWDTGATVFYGDGSGGVRSTAYLDTDASGYNTVKVDDVTGDNLPDVVITNGQGFGTVWVYALQAGGGLAPVAAYPIQWPAWGLAIGDLNGDGRNDVAVSQHRDSAWISILQQTVTGTLVPLIDLATLRVPEPMLSVDLDRDGRSDLVTLYGGYNQMGYYLQGATGLGAQQLVNLTGALTSHFESDGLAGGDLNGDACTDIAIADAGGTFGATALVVFHGKNCHSSPMSSEPALTRQAASCALHHDFDGDGKSDILWRNTSTGANVIWKSGNASTPQAVVGVTNQSWQVVGIGDFNDDGKADVFWRNTSTGANTIWKSGNASTQQPVASNTLGWKVAGTGDFNGDGKADVFWRNTSTGANTIWKSGNAGTPQPVVGVTNQRWQVVGIGDFNGDGKSDILWRSASTGSNVIWRSASSATTQAVTAVTNLAWKVVGVGDFNDDGKSDILWRNTTTGSNVIWKSGNAGMPQAVVGVTDQSWQVVAVADYDADGTADILWCNRSTGANSIWKSARASTTQAVSDMPDTAWKVVP